MSAIQLQAVDDGPAQTFKRTLAAAGSTDCAAYRARWRSRPCRVYVSRDPYGRLDDGSPDFRWHISVSQEMEPSKVPPWGALVAIAHKVRPGVPLVVGVPPRSQWMNVHEGVLHLVEVKDPNLIAQWRFEARGDVHTAASG